MECNSRVPEVKTPFIFSIKETFKDSLSLGYKVVEAVSQHYYNFVFKIIIFNSGI